MIIASRQDLREAAPGALGGAVLIAAAFWFRREIEFYIGHTATILILYAVLGLDLLWLNDVILGWVRIVRWERADREKKREEERELAKLEMKEKQGRAEYDAFRKWADLNPRTVERLLAIVELEQIDDPEYISWLSERRQKEGPCPLTDLPRLFNWLEARRELKKFGMDPPLPPL
jgi:hypothetical protein